jgi:hypothetical protein
MRFFRCPRLGEGCYGEAALCGCCERFSLSREEEDRKGKNILAAVVDGRKEARVCVGAGGGLKGGGGASGRLVEGDVSHGRVTSHACSLWCEEDDGRG